MTTTPKDTVEEIKREVEAEYQMAGLSSSHGDYASEVAKRYGDRIRAEILTKDIEEMEGMKKEYCKEDVLLEKNKPYDWHGYSHAITDLLTRKKEALEALLTKK